MEPPRRSSNGSVRFEFARCICHFRIFLIPSLREVFTGFATGYCTGHRLRSSNPYTSDRTDSVGSYDLAVKVMCRMGHEHEPGGQPYITPMLMNRLEIAGRDHNSQNIGRILTI